MPTAPPYTKRNHYIPAAIIGNFSDNPLPTRRSSLVRFEVKGGPKKGLSTSAERLFCVSDFYTLPNYKQDKLRTGLLLYSWHQVLPLVPPPVVSSETLEADLVRIADEYAPEGNLRADVVERMLAADIDGPFCDVAGRLQVGALPSGADLTICRRFLGLSYVRGPAWANSGPCARLIRQSRRDARRRIKLGTGVEHDDAWQDPLFLIQDEVIADMTYVVGLGLSIADKLLSMSSDKYALELLVAAPGSAFVLADNCGRPYNQKVDPRNIEAEYIGLDATDVAITFPIGPQHCLRMSRRPQGDRFRRIQITAAEVLRINTALLTLADRTVVLPPGEVDLFLHGVTIPNSARWVER